MWRRRRLISRRLQKLCSSLRMALGTQSPQVRFVLHLQASRQIRQALRRGRKHLQPERVQLRLACGVIPDLSVQLLVCDISRKQFPELCISGRFRWSGDPWSQWVSIFR